MEYDIIRFYSVLKPKISFFKIINIFYNLI
jgi:hypothetical protein